MRRYETFRNLPEPSETDAWSIEPPNGTAWRVGRSHEGYPALLIAFDVEHGLASPRRLALLTYAPPASMRVIDGSGKPSSTRLAVLQCQSLDLELARYFFRVVASLTDDPAFADEAAFDSALEAVVAIFRALQQPSENTVQGLWAELAVVLWAPDARAALSAWHSSPRALHDFSSADGRIEVKSTVRPLREHVFRLEQLTGGTGPMVLVVSMLLTEREDGQSVIDLVERIRRRVDHVESVRRLETVVGASLGKDWKAAEAVRYDLDRARQDVRLYLAADIPKPSTELPPAVKDVRFTVDLSAVEQTSRQQARSITPLAGAIVPSE